MNDFVSPAVLAMNIIRHIGDHVLELGTAIPQLIGGAGIVGATNHKLVSELIEELQDRGCHAREKAGQALAIVTRKRVHLSPTSQHH